MQGIRLKIYDWNRETDNRENKESRGKLLWLLAQHYPNFE